MAYQKQVQTQPTPQLLQCNAMWRGFLVCAVAIYVDSVVYTDYVFDANGLLWTILGGCMCSQV
jgi:hypothetical protein